MRRMIVLAAALAIPATIAVAQMPMAQPGSKNPAAVTGGTYAVDSSHTLIGFRVNHLGFNDYFGIFGESTGTLTIDPKNPNGAKVDITIPVAKVTTANAALTAHLLRPGKDGAKPDFFGEAPADAHFVSTAVKATGMKAKTTIKRSDFGVSAAIPLVSDAVALDITVAFQK